MTIEEALLKTIPELGKAAPFAFVAWVLLQRLLTILAEDRAQVRTLTDRREQQLIEREAQLTADKKAAVELEQAKLANLEKQTQLAELNLQATKDLRREVERGAVAVREGVAQTVQAYVTGDVGKVSK